MKKFTFLSLFVLALLSISTVKAQDTEGIISTYLNNSFSKLGVQAEDVSDFRIVSDYMTQKNGLQHVVVEQEVNNIPIYNGLGNFAIRNNEVFYFANNLVNDVNGKFNTATPSVDYLTAVQNAANQLQLGTASDLQVISSGVNEYVLSNGGVSQENIPVRLVYQLSDDESALRLAWDLSMLANDGKNWWSVRVDATTGQIISQNDWILNCSFGETGKVHEAHSKNEIVEETGFGFASNMLVDGSEYRVYPMPVESPIHGSRQLVSQPADILASPFGWHDNNGVPGPEDTTTRGNNVRAVEDTSGNDSPSGFAPDGGTDLSFDFPVDLNEQPAVYQEAAITNLFYWNNIMHDVWFQYGFDAPSGNFQRNNYGAGGSGFDNVNADAQDGSGINNATFGTPPDGQRPRMSMFLWSPVGPPGTPLTVNAPGSVAGDYEAIEAGFGGSLTDTPIIADFALMVDNDTTGDANDGCDPITNGAALNNRIAVVRRGSCNFTVKVSSAQQAGALAVIVVTNTTDPIFAMGGEDASITIPSVMISMADGEPIIDALLNGTTVNGQLVADGPPNLDGDFDNGIIAHEYGHGISNRLTGGPAAAGCLGNSDQMGEGWSDYFGLMLTIQPGAQATDIRGIGTYVIGQDTDGNGIRPAPYTTDTAINNFTYGATNNANILSEPHGIGFMWSTILWDMTWDLIARYGYDADLYNGTGGNNIAMQLVIDGLKLQPCSPGFIDGRDAILAADMANNGGVNQCAIYQAFADRGVGFSAAQGNTDNRFDQVEAFDMPPESELDCALSVDESNLDVFKVFPNPAKTNLNISLGNTFSGPATATLIDVQGRQIKTMNFEASQLQTMDVSNISNGIYVLKLDINGKSLSTKVVIE